VSPKAGTLASTHAALSTKQGEAREKGERDETCVSLKLGGQRGEDREGPVCKKILLAGGVVKVRAG